MPCVYYRSTVFAHSTKATGTITGRAARWLEKWKEKNLNLVSRGLQVKQKQDDLCSNRFISGQEKHHYH